MNTNGIGALEKLGAGLKKAQSRFEEEELPFSVVATFTSDSGLIVEAKFLLADLSFPLAWSSDTQFFDVNEVVSLLFAFERDIRPTMDILEAKVSELRVYMAAVVEANPEVAEFNAAIDEAREEFREFRRIFDGDTGATGDTYPSRPSRYVN